MSQPKGRRLVLVAHSEIKLKQDIETAWNSCRLILASLAYFEKYANEAETSLKLFQAVSLFYFISFQNLWWALVIGA